MNICAYSTCDESYIQNSIVSLLSVRKWNHDIDLFVISKKLTDKAKALAKKHDIGVIELDLTSQFSTNFEYPVECYYLFAGPEHFLEKGYDYSLYIDGDVYCNSAVGIDWASIRFFAGVSVGAISDLLHNDLDKIFQIWEEKEVPEHRVQTGVLAFNNAAMKQADLLNKIVNLYQKSLENKIPRRGDDSLFSLFQLIHQNVTPLLLSDDYNCILPKLRLRPDSKQYITTFDEKIDDCIFFHFTDNVTKPWKKPKRYLCYLEEYFSKKWRNTLLDTFSEEDCKAYFPSLGDFYNDDEVKFYWWGETNVGDLLTPYYLEKVCGLQSLSSLKAVEERKTQSEGSGNTLPGIRSLIARIVRKCWLVSKSIGVPARIRMKRQSPERKTIISTGSIMRLCSPETTVYGSGIRSADQAIQPGNIEFVRGPITRDALIKIGCGVPPIYGDPGLLMSKFYQPKHSGEKYALGIIPHFSEYAEVAAMYENEGRVLVIDMGSGDIESTIDQITNCDRVVSSSLHGIVFANSYSIPVRWIKFSDRVFGDDTKYRDYFSSIGRINETYVNASGFKRLDIEKMLSYIDDYVPKINFDRLQDAMFFDENGLKRSVFWKGFVA